MSRGIQDRILPRVTCISLGILGGLASCSSEEPGELLVRHEGGLSGEVPAWALAPQPLSEPVDDSQANARFEVRPAENLPPAATCQTDDLRIDDGVVAIEVFPDEQLRYDERDPGAIEGPVPILRTDNIPESLRAAVRSADLVATLHRRHEISHDERASIKLAQLLAIEEEWQIDNPDDPGLTRPAVP